MRKLLTFIIFTLVLTLSSCNFNRIDYTDFEANKVISYYESETMSNNRYIVYYYDSDDENSTNIKGQILTFFEGFETLEFYLLDTKYIETETSNFGEYVDDPIIYVISNKKVLETYKGTQQINDFISKYTDIVFDYDLFENQHVTSYQEILDIENDSYILYYYLDSCPHCIATKPFLLPTELIILNSGTPILVLMSNGKFANEFYSGSAPVEEYILEIGNGDIIAKELQIDYDEFFEHFIDDYENTLTISDELHFEYYFSPYCGHCISIKPNILNFFKDNNELEFYLINTTEADGSPKIVDFQYIPALYIVLGNEVVASFVGAVVIPEFIEDFNNGNIDLTEYE